MEKETKEDESMDMEIILGEKISKLIHKNKRQRDKIKNEEESNRTTQVGSIVLIR